MTVRATASGFALLSALALVALSPARTHAQEQQGVRIGLTYAAGTRPSLYVLPMRGANADSIHTIDRKSVV